MWTDSSAAAVGECQGADVDRQQRSRSWRILRFIVLERALLLHIGACLRMTFCFLFVNYLLSVFFAPDLPPPPSWFYNCNRDTIRLVGPSESPACPLTEVNESASHSFPERRGDTL